MDEAKKLVAMAQELIADDDKAQELIADDDKAKPKKPRKNTQQANAEFLAWIKQNLDNQAVKTMREIWEKKYYSEE